MNKRYMDFVPTRKAKNAPKMASSGEVMRAARPAMRTSLSRTPVAKVSHTQYTARAVSENERIDVSANTFSIRSEAMLGVVEDLNPKFVQKNVPKRPLSKRPKPRMEYERELAEIKSRKLVGNRRDVIEEEVMMRPKKTAEKDNYVTPKTPFINQAKVEKRPLSKHVYTKKIEPVKEEKRGPVKIIEKPEKDGKIGLVITIILTIIMGAAAGTIAFLLLPK